MLGVLAFVKFRSGTFRLLFDMPTSIYIVLEKMIGCAITHLSINFKSSELRSSIRKDPHHLRSITLIQIPPAFIPYDGKQTGQDRGAVYVGRLSGLQQDFHAVKRRHSSFRYHSRHT